MDHHVRRGDYIDEVQYQVVSELGLPSIAGRSGALDDIQDGILNESTEIVWSVLEAELTVAQDRASVTYGHDRQALDNALSTLHQKTVTVLREHRVSFELVSLRFIPFESRELHSEVVAPVLTLLGRDERFGEAESAYQEALNEISKGTPDDAITDAARALETMLEILGCSGNTLGKKLTVARERGLLGVHDSQLQDAILKMGSWVSADRATKGDTHPGGTATVDDAWFIVHVVGALILRLSRSPARGSSA